MRVRATLKRLALAAAAIPVTAIAGQFCIDIADAFGLFREPLQKVAHVRELLHWLVTNPWFAWSGGLTIGLAIGLWADTILHRVEAEQLRSLSDAMHRMSDELKIDRSKGAPPRIAGRSKLRALYLSTEKLGIPTPKYFHPHEAQEHVLELHISYLDAVSPMLERGHFREAKEIAAAISEGMAAVLSEGEPEKRRSFLETIRKTRR